MKLLALSFALAACAHAAAPTPAPAPTPAADPTCDQVADHVVALADPAFAQGDVRVQIRTQVVDRCTRDAWPAATRACVATASDDAPCVASLPQAARRGYIKAKLGIATTTPAGT